MKNWIQLKDILLNLSQVSYIEKDGERSIRIYLTDVQSPLHMVIDNAEEMNTELERIKRLCCAD
jgi:hypothetical protein